MTLINNGTGYAFMSQKDLVSTLVVKPDGSSNNLVQFQWTNQIRSFFIGRTEAFVISSLDNGPQRIYEYNFASGSTDCAVPTSEQAFEYLNNCTITRNFITNFSGDILIYYLYAPPNASAKNKHPLILGELGVGPMGFGWSCYHEAFADCGFYYVYVERYQRSYSQWGQDVLTTYETLAKRPDIDTNNVYLYGISGGVAAIYELLSEKPKLWRGVVLYSPTSLPNPSLFSGKRVFIDTGGDDPAFSGKPSETPIEFQDEAARDGAQLTLLVHPHIGHVFRYPPGERERLRETLFFLNDP